MCKPGLLDNELNILAGIEDSCLNFLHVVMCILALNAKYWINDAK